MSKVDQALLKEHAERVAKQLDDISNPKTLSDDFMKLLQCSFITLPTGKSGEYEVKVDIIPPEQELTVVSMRNWFMMGYKPLKVTKQDGLFTNYSKTVGNY